MSNRLVTRLRNIASTALVAAGHFRNVDQSIPLAVSARRHPLAGFSGFGRKRKVRRRVPRKRKMGKKGKARLYNKVARRRAFSTRKKIAATADLPHVQNIVNTNGSSIVGGATSGDQVWNTIGQGVGAGQRIGDRVRRTGLWVNISFCRDLPQGSEENNHKVRVIWARQKSHGAFPTTGAAATHFPAWPTFNECFSRDWFRSYKLVKDSLLFFGLRNGLTVATDVKIDRTYKFKFNYPCTFEVGGNSDMDVGRLYLYVISPDANPAEPTDLRFVINHYCSYFVDELG